MKGLMVNSLLAAAAPWNTKGITLYAYSLPFPHCSGLFIVQIPKIEYDFKRHITVRCFRAGLLQLQMYVLLLS